MTQSKETWSSHSDMPIVAKWCKMSPTISWAFLSIYIYMYVCMCMGKSVCHWLLSISCPTASASGPGPTLQALVRLPKPHAPPIPSQAFLTLPSTPRDASRNRVWSDRYGFSSQLKSALAFLVCDQEWTTCTCHCQLLLRPVIYLDLFLVMLPQTQESHRMVRDELVLLVKTIPNKHTANFKISCLKDSPWKYLFSHGKKKTLQA